MVNSSKVLTVSYGTFSCTLEGFDDSFETMKAIAEYFRDLAADDRYFGAEPPTPDADMLARIAEREVARRVEAHQEGEKIVLRTALPAAAAVETAEVDPAPAQVTPTEDTVEANAAVAEDAEEAVDAEAERAELDALEEQKRAEIRARRQARREAAQAAEREAAEKAEREAAEQAEREAAQKAEREAAEKAAAAQAEKEAAEEAAREAAAREAEEHARQAEREAQEKAERENAEKAATAASDDDGDSVAAKLARIRAVVGQPAEASVAPDYSEDEHADDIMQGRADDTDLEDILEPERAEETADAEAAEPEQAPLRARVIKMKREEFEAALASGQIEEAEDEVEAEAETVEPAVDSSLSADEEDELARELAAVEAELAGEIAPSQPAEMDLDADDEIAPAPQPARTRSPRGADELRAQPDQEIDRLMSQAGSELEEPEVKQRRSAIGHLRAAVAAARADKEAAPLHDPVDEAAEYREDLQNTVQPRRPVRRLTAEDEPQSASTARPPLKLVAEQRVDTPQPEAASGDAPAPTPVRPRRIRAGETPPAPQAPQSEVAPEGGSFLDFAEEMGATELPDLLEAAAAYLAYVEGREQFSRPQLMTKVRMVQDEEFSREDGLRSFGQLLRQGKIEKISGGRFTVSDRISFKPDTRAAG